MKGLINGTISTKNTPNENIIAVFVMQVWLRIKTSQRIVKD